LTGTAERTTVHFTVYGGREILYTGDLETDCIGTGALVAFIERVSPVMPF